MYAVFLLLPHLSHLCCLHINLREAKREIVTTLLFLLSRSPCYPRVRLLAAEQKPPQDFPQHFQPTCVLYMFPPTSLQGFVEGLLCPSPTAAAATHWYCFVSPLVCSWERSDLLQKYMLLLSVTVLKSALRHLILCCRAPRRGKQVHLYICKLCFFSMNKNHKMLRF